MTAGHEPIVRRILMTADTVGGVWTYALELVLALREHGVEVGLATMGAPLTSEQRKEVRQIRSLELFESTYKLEWMEDPWHDVRRAGEWLLGLEERLRPDVVHLNGYVHGALPWRSPTLVVGHSCVLSWWSAVHGEAAPATWGQYRSEVARGIDAAGLVIAPSKAMLSALNRHYGPVCNGRVVPNGRSPARILPAAKERFVLSAGRLWDRAKNMAALERVAPKLTWPVCLAGEEQPPDGKSRKPNLPSRPAPPRPGEQPSVDGISRPPRMRFLGRLSAPALAAWFSRASIYALPARYEPFGLSALEAGLAACALVVGDIPSLREVWDDAALFVPPEDAEALEAALSRLISDAPLRTALASRARLRALQFTPRRMATAYLQAYREVSGRQAAQGPALEVGRCRSDSEAS
jgi:glycogen synthase